MSDLLCLFSKEHDAEKFLYELEYEGKITKYNDTYVIYIKNAIELAIHKALNYPFNKISGKTKIGEFYHKNLGAFGVNCTDTDLPMLEDIYNSIINNALKPSPLSRIKLVSEIKSIDNGIIKISPVLPRYKNGFYAEKEYIKDFGLLTIGQKIEFNPYTNTTSNIAQNIKILNSL